MRRSLIMDEKFVIGQYVRCPVEIINEEEDNENPRIFILAQITKVDDLSEEVSVKWYDLMSSRQYFTYRWHEIYSWRKVHRCLAARDAWIETEDGPGKIIVQDDCAESKCFFQYYVRLQNGKVKKYRERELKIDYSMLNYSPLNQLREYEFQNPTWYAQRRNVSRVMNTIDNMMYGFQILSGCRVFLMPHQITAVSRMLETEPIRYILADEVGLGKTIEACSIVKILCAENIGIKIAYVVPMALANQWRTELKYKFSIMAMIHRRGEKIESHCIIPMEEVAFQSDVLNYPWDALIIDEAHRLLSSEETEEKQYQSVLKLSKKIKNVLLLSATPIQSRKLEYFRLLQLLDPEHYFRISMDAFSSLVDKQNDIRDSVNSIVCSLERSGFENSKVRIGKNLNLLDKILKDDTFSTLVKQINFDHPEIGEKNTRRAIGYVSENYRIERKIIRNRRCNLKLDKPLAKRVLMVDSDKLSVGRYLPKSAEDGYDEYNVYNNLLEWLVAYPIQDYRQVKEIAQPLLGGMFSSPWALEEELRRLSVSDEMLLRRVNTWKLQAEAEINQIDYFLDEDPEKISGRLLRAVDYIEQEIPEDDKIVVFTSFLETLKHFFIMLDKRGHSVVKFHQGMDDQDLEDSVYEFQNNTSCQIILCDATGGEGRNFQNADWVIHLDLPWTANAIEQRIGRLDRLGREENHLEVRSVVFYTEGTIEAQLFRIWNKGMNLFAESLSGLEIITGELNQMISKALLEDFSIGLELALPQIIEMTLDARDQLEEESLYDLVSTTYRSLARGIEDMLRGYELEGGNLFQEAMLSWSNQAGLRPMCHELVTFDESGFSKRAATKSMLVPPRWSLYKNSSIVLREHKILGTFDRDVAIKREDLLFYAPGDPVFDAIISNAMNCARGRCCAFQVKAAFSFDGFVFTYNILPDIANLLKQNGSLRLLAQFRMYVPHSQMVISVPARNSGIPTQEQWESLFSDRHIIANDATNFGERNAKKGKIPLVEQFKSITPEWDAFVSTAEQNALNIANKKLEGVIDIKEIKEVISRIMKGYEAEYLYLGKNTANLAFVRDEYNKVLFALQHPTLQLDSVCYVKVTPEEVKA